MYVIPIYLCGCLIGFFLTVDELKDMLLDFSKDYAQDSKKTQDFAACSTRLVSHPTHFGVILDESVETGTPVSLDKVDVDEFVEVVQKLTLAELHEVVLKDVKLIVSLYHKPGENVLYKDDVSLLFSEMGQDQDEQELESLMYVYRHLIPLLTCRQNRLNIHPFL